jgi:dehydrogenase/reductase SDR family protein 7B
MSDKDFFQDKTAWITGGSSGIGEAIAKRLANSGAKLIISSHEPLELERVKAEIGQVKHPVSLLDFNLGNPEEVAAASEKVLDKFQKVDFFFSNGGVSQRNTAIETPVEMDRKIMEINYFSGVIISKKLLPSMIKNGGGHIIATSSISGKFGFPLRSAYGASKHALHGFYESVWTELWDKNIKTTLVCPGRVKTNISINALGKDGKAHGKMDAGQASGISPDECAKQILRAVRMNKREVLVGGKELIMARLKQYCPRIFYKLVVKIKPS